MLGLTTLRRAFSLRDKAQWLSFYGGDTWAKRAVTPDSALQIATVWACVRLIAQIVSTLPIGVYTRQTDGSRKPAPTHPVALLLRDSPNGDQTPAEFLEALFACLLVYGNGFAVKTTTGGQVRALTILLPELVTIRRQDDGSITYAYADPRGRIEYGEDEVWHLKGFGFGGLLGLSPIAYARQTLATAMAADEVAGRTFANGMNPSGIITYEGKDLLTPAQRAQAKTALIDPISGTENAGKTLLMEGAAGFKWQSVSIPSTDAELLDSRRWHVEEICRWFCNTPPILIGHASSGQTMWGSGVEQIMLGWLTTGLDPLLVKVEQSMRRALITPAERATLYVEFVREGLLRADTAGRAEAYSKLMQVGAITPNQVADRENFPRFEGGDVHLVNSTLVPLHLAGQRPARVQPAPGEPIPEPTS